MKFFTDKNYGWVIAGAYVVGIAVVIAIIIIANY